MGEAMTLEAAAVLDPMDQAASQTRNLDRINLGAPVPVLDTMDRVELGAFLLRLGLLGDTMILYLGQCLALG